MPRRRIRRRRLPRVNVRRLESAHNARMQMMIEPLKEIVEQQLDPYLETFVSQSQTRTDDETDVVSAIFGRIRVAFASRFNPKRLNTEIKRSADQISSAGADAHRAQMRAVLGVDPVQAEPWIEREVNAFVKENTSLISTLPDEAISDIEQMIFREGRRGSSVAEIRRLIREQFQATENRAELIARDQVLKFNGRLTELRQKQAGITKYIWRDSNDGRVRPDHKRLDGQTFSWDDPPVTVTSGKRSGETNHPGQDIQCRCIAEPVLDDLIPGLGQTG